MKIIVMVVILIFCCYFFVSANDLLAADSLAAQYRTGKIDSYVKTVPPLILENAFKLPEVNLKPLVEFLLKGAPNNFQRVKRIHDWITLHIAYDYDLFYGKSVNGSRKVTELLPLKRTTCGGFSRLFAAMAELAGLEVLVIHGYSNSYLEKNNTPGDHAWNAVKIQGTWYLVDTTHDGRIAYEDGKYSELSDYSDAELFVSPKSKILVNLPENPDYQFLNKPISIEAFMKAPIRRMAFGAYGLDFPEQPYLNQFIVASEFRPGGKVKSRFNLVRSKGQAVKLFMDFPSGIMAKAYLYDKNDELVNFRSFCYREKNRVFFEFSTPGKGRFKAVIRAKDMSFPGLYNKVYEFYIDEEKSAGPMLPLKPGLYAKGGADFLKIHCIENNFSTVSANNIYICKIEHPSQIEVVAVLKNHMDVTLSNAEIVSILGDQRSYFFSLPGKGNYKLQILAKKSGADFYLPVFETYLTNLLGPGPALPPKDRLMVYNAFNQSEHELIQEPEHLDDGSWHFSVKASSEYYFKIKTRNKNKEDLLGYHCYSFSDSIYDIYISPPEPGYTTYVYQVDKQGQWRTILSYSFSETVARGPALPLPGKIYPGSESVFLDTKRTASSQNDYPVEIAVNINGDIEFWGMIYDNQNNRNYNDFITVSYEPGKKVYFFGVPGAEPYQAMVYTRRKGEENYSRLVCSVGLKSPSEKAVSSLPRGRLIFMKAMENNGFRFIDSNLPGVTGQKDFIIHVQNAPGFTMDCRVKNSANENVKGFYSTTHHGDQYEFRFTSPGQGEYTARVYQIDKKGNWNTLIYFLFP